METKVVYFKKCIPGRIKDKDEPSRDMSMKCVYKTPHLKILTF